MHNAEQRHGRLRCSTPPPPPENTSVTAALTFVAQVAAKACGDAGGLHSTDVLGHSPPRPHRDVDPHQLLAHHLGAIKRVSM